MLVEQSLKMLPVVLLGSFSLSIDILQVISSASRMYHSHSCHDLSAVHCSVNPIPSVLLMAYNIVAGLVYGVSFGEGCQY